MCKDNEKINEILNSVEVFEEEFKILKLKLVKLLKENPTFVGESLDRTECAIKLNSNFDLKINDRYRKVKNIKGNVQVNGMDTTNFNSTELAEFIEFSGDILLLGKYLKTKGIVKRNYRIGKKIKKCFRMCVFEKV